MQVSVERETSADRTAIRASEGDTIWVLINHVKAGKWEQHERFVHDILKPATEQVDAPVFRHTRFLHPRRPNEDGTYTSAWLMDPVLEGGNYEILSLLQQAYGEAKGEEYYQLWTDSLVRDQVGYGFLQSSW